MASVQITLSKGENWINTKRCMGKEAEIISIIHPHSPPPKKQNPAIEILSAFWYSGLVALLVRSANYCKSWKSLCICMSKQQILSDRQQFNVHPRSPQLLFCPRHRWTKSLLVQMSKFPLMLMALHSFTVAESLVDESSYCLVMRWPLHGCLLLSSHVCCQCI